MFKTLDRYIMRTFLHSLLMWFLVFMMMRIVIDLFVKMDEFTENLDEAGGLWFTVSKIAMHYFYHSFVYLTEMGGIVIVASAVFAVARMNHTNELTAMLASGVSLHRVVWPIIIAAIGFGALVVIDQELILPRISKHLTLEEDEIMQGKEGFRVKGVSDENHTFWASDYYDPKSKKLTNVITIVKSPDLRYLGSLCAKQGIYGKLGKTPGWFMTDASMLGQRKVMTKRGKGFKTDYVSWATRQSTERIYTTVSPNELYKLAVAAYRKLNPDKPAPKGQLLPWKPSPADDSGYKMVLTADKFRAGKPVIISRQGQRFREVHSGKLFNPRFEFKCGKDGKRTLAYIVADSATWHYDNRYPENSCWMLENGRIFEPSDMSPEELELRESGTYFDYMSSPKLRKILKAKSTVDIHAVKMAIYTRIANPINNIVMLMLGLPFILSRVRNIKMSAALCLLMVGSFYAFIYICRSMGLPDYLAAFLPILIFGPVSLLMLDSIKT